MYKVFFKDRTVHIEEGFQEVYSGKSALIYRYSNNRELRELIDSFCTMKHIRNLHIFHEDMKMLMEEFRSCFTNIDAGGGVVLNELGEFLVIKRNGIWDLPKGKLEKDENFESAAIREVEEETGLGGLELGHPLLTTYHTYEQGKSSVLKRTCWYLMKCRGSQELRLEEREGITEARWVKPGETDFIVKNSFSSILDLLSNSNLL